MVNGWKAGNFTGDSSDKTAQKNAHSIGRVQALEEVLGMIDDDISQEAEEEEHDN